MRRRALGLFFAAIIAAVLAVTSRWLLQALPTVLGFLEDNSELIGAIESSVSIVQLGGLALFTLFTFFGVKELRKLGEGQEPAPSVNVSEGGPAAVVGGEVNQSAVVAGDNNTISVNISGDVNYKYSDVTPSQPDPAELEEAIRHLEELPLEHVPRRTALPDNSVMPLRPNQHFVGRNEQLRRVAAALKGGETTAIGEAVVTASSGLGGVGKTQLASEFVHRYGQFFHGVYWLSFAAPGGVPAEVASCGGAGGMNLRPDFHTLPLEERVKAVMAAWQSGLPRLLIFDNCDREDLLDRWLPPAGGSRVLITGRRPQWDPQLGVIELPLDVLARVESIELLRKYRQDLPPSSAELDAIAEELGDLPLALDLAGRYLRRYQHIIDACRYLQDIQSEEILGHRSLQDVGRTFAVSIRQLEEGDDVDRLAVRLLARAARFAPEEPIDRRLLLSILGPADEDPTLQQLEEREGALARLVNLGLIRELESGQVSMHVLVSEAARREIEDEEAQTSVERAVAVEVMGVVESKQPVRLEPLMPHLRQMLSAVGNRFDEPAYLIRFAMGHALLASRYPVEAAPYLQRAVEYKETLLQASTDPEERQSLVWLVMRQRNDLAVAFKRSGDLDGALEVHERLLADRRNNLPQPHEDVASTLTNIGALKAKLRILHEILPLYEEALDIREAVLAQKDDEDPDKIQLHRDVAESHGNLGAFYMDLGQPHQAATNYRRAVDIHEDLEETENEAYANYAMELGTALRLLEDFEGARSSLESALRIHKLVLPKKDTRIVKNLILFGTLLAGEAVRERKSAGEQQRETLNAARERLDEALDHLRQEWGEDYPLTAGVMRSAADVATAEDRQEDAEPLRARAEAIREDIFQEADAGFIGESLKSLAVRGLFEDAEIYGRRALELRRAASEGESLEVAQAELDLGLFLLLVGRGSDAERHLRKALNIREEILGP